jgi:hypothetical protein
MEKNKIIGWVAILFGFVMGYNFLEVLRVDFIPYYSLTNYWGYAVIFFYILYYAVPSILLIYFGNKERKIKNTP